MGWKKAPSTPHDLRKIGVSVGHIGPSYRDMKRDERDALIDDTIKSRSPSVADFLVKFYLDSRKNETAG